jgi:hypothetical protein
MTTVFSNNAWQYDINLQDYYWADPPTTTGIYVRAILNTNTTENFYLGDITAGVKKYLKK